MQMCVRLFQEIHLELIFKNMHNAHTLGYDIWKIFSWLRKMVVINGCCLFFCLVSDHVKPSPHCEGVRERTREGSGAPRGEKVGKSVQL